MRLLVIVFAASIFILLWTLLAIRRVIRSHDRRKAAAGRPPDEHQEPEEH